MARDFPVECSACGAPIPVSDLDLEFNEPDVIKTLQAEMSRLRDRKKNLRDALQEARDRAETLEDDLKGAKSDLRDRYAMKVLDWILDGSVCESLPRGEVIGDKAYQVSDAIMECRDMDEHKVEPAHLPDSGTPNTCVWSFSGDADCRWDTSCGEAHQFSHDGPTENRFQFCPYCGRKLAVNPPEVEEVEVADDESTDTEGDEDTYLDPDEITQAAREEVFELFCEERQRQIEDKDYDRRHDRDHSMGEWCGILMNELGDLSDISLNCTGYEAFDRQMVKIAAVCVAYLEDSQISLVRSKRAIKGMMEFHKEQKESHGD